MKRKFVGFVILDESDEILTQPDPEGDNNAPEVPYFSASRTILEQVAIDFFGPQSVYPWRIVPAELGY